MLARNFGIMVNADAFEGVAQSIPINILAKHKNQIHQLEALLLGQANLLPAVLFALLLQPLARFVPRPNREPKEPEPSKPGART